MGRSIKARFARRATVLPLLALSITLLLWEAAVRLFQIPVYLLPAPSGIAAEFIANPSLLLEHFAYTALVALLGFALAVVVGLSVAILLVYSSDAEAVVYPYLVLIQVTPIVAIAPLLSLWLGFGLAPKVIVAFLVAFFPIAVNGAVGMRSPDRDMVMLLRSLAASEFEVFRDLRFPYALPFIFSACRIAAPASVVGAIVAEFIASNHGLGYLIIRARAVLDTELLFLAIFAAAVLGIVLFTAIRLIERQVLGWHSSQVRQ